MVAPVSYDWSENCQKAADKVVKLTEAPTSV